MRRFKLHSIVLLIIIIAACQSSTPSFDDIDLLEWKADRNGCEGSRIPMTESIRSQKDKLLGLSESSVVELLGRPDRNELYDRNQKFYYYYLTPAPACGDTTVEHLTRLSIRFNAVGRAKEVSIDQL